MVGYETNIIKTSSWYEEGNGWVDSSYERTFKIVGRGVENLPVSNSNGDNSENMTVVYVEPK